LLTTLPVIWKVYDAIGYTPPTGSNAFPAAKMERLTSQTAGADPLDWQHSFRKLFEVGPAGRPGDQTAAAEVVAATGYLSAAALAKSLLQSGVVSGHRPPRSNPVTRFLAEDTGLVTDARLLADADVFVSRAGMLLDGFAALDATLGSQQFVAYDDGLEYRLAPSGSFGTHGLVAPAGGAAESWPVQGRVIQSTSYFSADATAKLEELMNANALEGDFQRFFEDHPEFLLALGP